MINCFFSHAGEVHTTITEATQHHSNGISASALFWIVLVIVPFILLAAMQLLKFQLSTKLLLLSTFLILYGVVSHLKPGVYSVISIALGFSIVLFLTLVGLMKVD